jgi:hypothetical protein
MVVVGVLSRTIRGMFFEELTPEANGVSQRLGGSIGAYAIDS